jgi:2-deoxy-D-gluconate 3-dehydrogenase
VINIASIDGIHNARIETYSYSASKAGVIHLTRRLAKRLAAENILVNAIAPGAFASDMNVWARDEPEKVSERIPVGRVGEPADIAGTAVYMCSRAGDYLVGITIPVDGGVALAK